MITMTHLKDHDNSSSDNSSYEDERYLTAITTVITVVIVMTAVMKIHPRQQL